MKGGLERQNISMANMKMDVCQPAPFIVKNKAVGQVNMIRTIFVMIVQVENIIMVGVEQKKNIVKIVVFQ